MRTNVYAGKCDTCGQTVEAGKGLLQKLPNGSFVVFHHHCYKPEMETQQPDNFNSGVKTMVKPEDQAVDKLIQLIANKMTETVPTLVQDNLDRLSRVSEIKIGKLPAVKVDLAHKALEDVLCAVVAGASPMLVGPAGSGKTTLAEQICKVLKRKFYMEARVTSEYKLIGFIDAHGKVVRTQFREAYENGGGFLFDEVDASDADAMTAFNAALANGQCAFPDKLVTRHKDFFAIAAGNTFGRGADRQYVGRNQLDAATLDRFSVFEVDYDNELEVQLSGNADWCARVQAVRKAIEAANIRHIVSPRASITGAKLLAAGMAQHKVEEAVIWKGLDHNARQRVEGAL